MQIKRIKLLLVTFLFWFSHAIGGPYQTVYLKSLGVAMSFIGSIVGATGLTQMILRIPLGLMADRKARHKVFICLSTILCTTGSIMRFALPSGSAFYLSNLIGGTGAAMWISYTVLFGKYYEPSDMGKAMSTIMVADTAGILSASIAGSIISQIKGIPYIYLCAAVASALGFIIALTIEEEKDEKQAVLPISSLLQALKDRRLLIYAILAAIIMGVHTSITSFVSQVSSGLGASNFEIGIYSMAYTGSAIFGSRLAGTAFIKKLGEKKTLGYSFAIYGLYALWVPRVPILSLLFVLQIIGGLSESCLYAALMGGATLNVDPQKKSTAMGFFQGIYGIGMTFVPSLNGMLVERYGLTGGFGGMAALCFAGLLIAVSINYANLNRQEAD